MMRPFVSTLGFLAKAFLRFQSKSISTPKQASIRFNRLKRRKRSVALFAKRQRGRTDFNRDFCLIH
jgi:hypothetical protein